MLYCQYRIRPMLVSQTFSSKQQKKIFLFPDRRRRFSSHEKEEKAKVTPKKSTRKFNS